MSEGWYPDPSGAPGSFRYWDGAAWGPQTTANPNDPLPGGARPEPPTVHTPQGPPQGPPQGAPQPPQAPAQPAGWANPQGQASFGYGTPLTQSGQGGSGGGGGRTALLVVAGVVVLLLLITGGFFGVRALTGDDGDDPQADPSTSDSTGSTDDPTDDPTDGPTDGLDPDNPTPTQCNGGNPYGRLPSQDDGRMQSGGLSVPFQTGYDLDLVRSAFAFGDRVAQRGQQYNKNWISVVAVGALRKKNGYENPEQAALTVMTCIAQSPDFYSDVSGTDQTQSESMDVDGQDGWIVTEEIKVDDAAAGVPGDNVQVVVVDTGDAKSFGFYLNSVPIGDQPLLDQQAQALDDLEVED